MTAALHGEVADGARRIKHAINCGEQSHARLMVSPCGTVEVRVPEHYPEVRVPEFMTSWSSWIVKLQDYLERYCRRELPRRYVSGESLRYFGRQHAFESRSTHTPNASATAPCQLPRGLHRRRQA